MSTSIDIRAEWTCPDCGARAGALHTVAHENDDWTSRTPIRRPREVEPMKVECAKGHTHPLPVGAIWQMTPEESAAIAAAEREAAEAAAAEAARFKARIEGRTIVNYAVTDGAIELTLDDGSALCIESRGYETDTPGVWLETR